MKTWNTRQQGRPPRTPDYRLTLAGQTISPALGARLQSLNLIDQRGFESDQLDITLTDHDNRLQLPPRGAELQLAIGWQGEGLINRGTYIVDEVEHSGAPDTLTLRGRTADLRQGLPDKRRQSWHELTLGDLITTIAARYGLSPRVADTLATTTIEHVDQTDESDLHFLTRLGERFDATATVKAGYLLFIPAGQATAASGLAIPPVRLSRQDGDRHRYIINDRDAFSGVIEYWHDINTAERHRVLVGSDKKPKRLRETSVNEKEARENARAEWNRIRRAGASFTLELAEGRPDLYPEKPVIADGWKPEIDDTPWIITQVTHSIRNAYTANVQMEVLPG
ncbi:MAG: phage late control D family protein [Exilibacterium sp.]